MNINQIKYFVLVHDCHSFSAAAKQKGISVQAVSKAVGELEREVGCELLTRSSRGVIATQAGRAFYKRARLAVSAFDSLERFSPNEDTLNGAPIKIALCAPAFDNSSELLKSFSSFFSKALDIQVELSLVDVRSAQAKLDDGSLDALVTIGTYEYPGTECKSLGTLLTGIRVAKTHPLAHNKEVTFAELRQYPAGESAIIDSFNNSILQLYRKAGAIDKIERLESLTEESYEFMVERNGYFFSAIFPQIVSENTQLILVPIATDEALRVPICVVTLEGQMTPEIEGIRSLMLQGTGLMHK